MICIDSTTAGEVISTRKNIQQDVALFEAIYQKYKENINSLIRARVKRACVTEDLVHDVFIKVWEYRKNIDQDRSIGGLLYRIALNAVYSYKSHEKVMKKYESYLVHSQFDSSDYPDSVLIANELNGRIEKVLQASPRKEKEVFKLFWEEGLSRQQIAEEEGLSIRTVDNHIYRAKKKVKQVLK